MHNLEMYFQNNSQVICYFMGIAEFTHHEAEGLQTLESWEDSRAEIIYDKGNIEIDSSSVPKSLQLNI